MHYIWGISAGQKVTRKMTIKTGEQSVEACQIAVAYRKAEGRCVRSLGTP